MFENIIMILNTRYLQYYHLRNPAVVIEVIVNVTVIVKYTN